MIGKRKKIDRVAVNLDFSLLFGESFCRALMNRNRLYSAVTLIFVLVSYVTLYSLCSWNSWPLCSETKLSSCSSEFQVRIMGWFIIQMMGYFPFTHVNMAAKTGKNSAVQQQHLQSLLWFHDLSSPLITLQPFDQFWSNVKCLQASFKH